MFCVLCFFLVFLPSKTQNQQQQKQQDCLLKPINNAGLQTRCFIVTQRWIPGCVMPLKCDPIRLKRSSNVFFYYSFTYSQLFFFLLLSPLSEEKHAYWLKTSVLLILEISLGLLFFISLYFLSLRSKWIILICCFMDFSTNTTNVFLFFLMP